MEGAKILVVDDDEVTRKNISRILSNAGYYVSVAKDGTGALTQLSKGGVDLVLTDLVMNGLSGLELLDKIKHDDPEIEIIMMTGYASIPTAIEAMKKGAYHYLEKPFRREEVQHLVGQAIEKRQLRRRVSELESRAKEDVKELAFIGESKEIQEVTRIIKQVARTDCNVLITGESGTGKELAASLLHHYSHRSKSKFLAVNCGAFTEELLANELFGHERGAFTGANSQKAGLLETASGGTFLLDEIGDTPLSMQVKLMRAIEEQKVIRVGGNQPIPIDVRIIAATNKDLKKAVGAGIFRHDLYFRLNVISISIPPLRERKQDIPLLAYFFLNRAAMNAGRKFKGFSDQAIKALLDYDFPGNVRELENIVERAVAMGREEEIQVHDLPSDLSEIEVFSFDHAGSNIKTLKDVQHDYIQWVLNRVGRNKTKAAKLLGIDRVSLWRHSKQNQIED
ncbi:MAG: sigma-54 dependent transcriptional regulator [Thermodesulfobacteriota bacterium]